jgi:hypothetical protein
VLTVLWRFRDRYLQIPPDITHGLMTELPDMPNDVFEVVPGVMMTILGHAAARGEVRLDKVTPRVAACLAICCATTSCCHRVPSQTRPSPKSWTTSSCP